MLRKMLAVMVAATLMAGTAWGANIAIDLGADASVIGTSSIGSGAVATTSVTSGAAVTPTIATAETLEIGSSKTPAGTYTLGAITSTSSGAIAIGAIAAGTEADTTVPGFTLNVASIDASGGSGALFVGPTNAVSPVYLNITTGSIKVAGATTTFSNSFVDVRGTGGSEYLTLDIDGGSYSDAGNVTIADDSDWKGGTEVTIAGNLIFGDDSKTLTIDEASQVTIGGIDWDSKVTPTIVVDKESSLLVKNTTAVVITTDDDGPILNIGANDSTGVEGSSSVEFEGELKFIGDGTDVGLVGANEASLKAKSLVIGDGTDATVINASDLKVIVTEGTTIDLGATLQIDGLTDEYQGGIVVKDGGELEAVDGGTADAVAITAGAAGITLQDDATLTNSVTGGTLAFTINGDGGVNVVATSLGGTAKINSATGAIVIDKALTVQNDLEMTTANDGGTAGEKGITVGSYSQTAGDVTFGDDNNNFIVTGDAVIAGTSATATTKFIASNTAAYDASDNTVAVFNGGLTVGKYGIVTSDNADPDAGIYIGDKTLTLSGGTLQTGATDNLTVYATTGSKILVNAKESNITMLGGADFVSQAALEIDATYEGGPTLFINATAGTEVASFADVLVKNGELALNGDASVQTDKNVTVNSGAYIANLGNATFVGNGTDSKFIANKGSNIEAHNGSYTIDATFTSATFDGNILVGMTGGTVNKITSDATDANTFGANANVVFTPQAAAAAKTLIDGGGQYDLIIADADTLDIKGTLFQNNGVGSFEFERISDPVTGDRLILKSAANIIEATGSEEDRLKFWENVQNAWAGAKGIGQEIDFSLASAAYDSVAANTTTPLGQIDPAATNEWGDATFGLSSINLLQELTNRGGNYTQGVGKSIFRNGDVSETLNAGVGEIRGITSAIGTRNTQLRGQMAGANDVYYEYANPTLLLNNDYANRIWAGYIGQWEKGDTRNGVSGYDYDSHGFIIGYDRLVGCNFAFGGAFAYSRGDYEDKAATSNSSKIDNYSVNGYATYSALNGVFASLFGGYTHQKNDIQASYAGATMTTVKKSDYDTDYWHIGGQLGYDFQPVAGLVLTPSIGLQYIHGRADSHFSNWWNTVSPSGGYVNSATQESLLLPIEIAARYTIDFSDCSRLAIEGNLGYSYNFMDSDSNADMILANVSQGGGAAGNAVPIAGYDRDAGRHTFNAGAGLRYTVNRFDIGVKYDYYLQQDAHAHRVMGSVGVSF